MATDMIQFSERVQDIPAGGNIKTKIFEYVILAIAVAFMLAAALALIGVIYFFYLPIDPIPPEAYQNPDMSLCWPSVWAHFIL